MVLEGDTELRREPRAGDPYLLVVVLGVVRLQEDVDFSLEEVVDGDPVGCESEVDVVQSRKAGSVPLPCQT